jgi:hypothetical protein
LNAYVAAYFSTEEWVNFKLWGYVFPLVFIVAQGVYIARHLPKEEETVLGEWTKGEWEVFSGDWIYCGKTCIATIQHTGKSAETKANALRIVECVNNFKSVVDALKDVLENGTLRKTRNSNTISKFSIKIDFDIRNYSSFIN